MEHGEKSIPRTAAAIQQGMLERLHIGAQVYVVFRGQVLADLALGESRPGVAMTPDTLMLWLSAGKPLTAVAIAQLWEQGKLDLDDPVSRYIPPFAAHGKQAITIRHVLTHTGGFRGAILSNWDLVPWDQIIQQICDSRRESGWVPGQKAGYHVAAGWFILGQIIQQLSGQSFAEYMRQRILLPTGMNDCWFALSAEQYRAYGDRLGILESAQGAEASANGWDTPEQAALARPGASARGPVRELGRFYQMLLQHGQSPASAPAPAQILRPQTVEALTARHRTGMLDQTFKHVIDWGLGLIINSSMYGAQTVPYGFGPGASPRTFGHGGAQSSLAFADPERGVVVAMLLNGTPGELRHHQRMQPVLAALWEDIDAAVRDASAP